MANELNYDYGVPISLVYSVTDVNQSTVVDGILAGANAANGFVVPTGYAFHALFIDVESNAARTAGTAVVKVTADGTELTGGPEATLDATNTTRHQGVMRIGADPIAAGAEVGVSGDGDGSWTPETADFDVLLVGVLLPA